MELGIQFQRLKCGNFSTDLLVRIAESENKYQNEMKGIHIYSVGNAIAQKPRRKAGTFFVLELYFRIPLLVLIS